MYEGRFRTMTADRLIHNYEKQFNSGSDTIINSEVNVKITMPTIVLPEINITINLPSSSNEENLKQALVPIF